MSNKKSKKQIKNTIKHTITESPELTVKKHIKKMKTEKILPNYFDLFGGDMLVNFPKNKPNIATFDESQCATTTAISQISTINNKKMKGKKVEATSSDHLDVIKDSKVPSTSSSKLIQLPYSKFILNSPPSPIQPIMFRNTSTPMVGKEMERLNFTNDSEMIEDKDNTKDIMPLLPTLPVPKKRMWMLASEKLKLGILNSKPKFCPFCNFVCENRIYDHIKSKHTDQLKFPTTVSAEAIKKIILNSTKKNKILVPLHRIISIMGNYWSDPEMRKISYELCLLGRLTIYGGSWNLENVPDIPNPFTQYIIQTDKGVLMAK